MNVGVTDAEAVGRVAERAVSIDLSLRGIQLQAAQRNQLISQTNVCHQVVKRLVISNSVAYLNGSITKRIAIRSVDVHVCVDLT